MRHRTVRFRSSSQRSPDVLFGRLFLWPPGVGFQESASNHPELLRSKGVVVNVHLFVFTSRRKDRVKILYWGVSRM
jgi:hypothetical protein